jgi:hypothetical protein
VKDALDMRLLPLTLSEATRRRQRAESKGRRVPAGVIAAGVVAIFLMVVGYAKATGSWEGRVPEHVFFELIPNAARYAHPR